MRTLSMQRIKGRKDETQPLITNCREAVQRPILRCGNIPLTSLPTARHAHKMHIVPHRNEPVVEPWLGHEHGIERVGQGEALERGLGSEPLLEGGCILA